MQSTPTTKIIFGGSEYDVANTDIMRVILQQQDRAQAERRLNILSGFDGIFNDLKASLLTPAGPTLLGKIGDEMHGGIYAGIYFDLEEGRFKHLIAAKKALPNKHNWADAIAAAKKCDTGGFTDWRLPNKPEGHVLQMYLQTMGKLGKGWHWTSAPYDSYYAWVLDFENGDVGIGYRVNEYGVLLVRSIPA